MPNTRSRFGNPLYQRHVSVDAKKTLDSLDKISDLVSGANPKIVIMAHREHQKEINRAFSSKQNPQTGRSWPRRKHSYPWPLMEHTGTLKGLVLSGFGIKTSDGRQKIYGKVRAGYYLGGYSRGGGGAFLGAHKPVEEVAGAVFFGRKRARSAAGWKPKAHGYLRTRGQMILHGGGTKLSDPASTGTTPPRPFFGFGQMAKFRVRRFADRLIKEAHD